MILQYIYRPILNAIYEKIIYRIPEKIRNICICFSFFMIFTVQFLSQYILGYSVISRGTRDYIICLFLAIIILFSINKKLDILRWNKTIYIPYVIVAFLILIASIDHYLGVAYKAFPFAMLIAFMCLYYVWGNRNDFNILFKLLAKAYVIFAILLFIICLVKYPYYDNGFLNYLSDYSPFSINPNGVSKIFLPGLAGAVYLVSVADKEYTKCIYALASGGFISIIILTNSRAGILCAILVLFLYIMVSILTIIKNKKRVKESSLAYLKVMLCMTLMFLISVSILVLTSDRDRYDIQEAKKKVESIPLETQLNNMSEKEKYVHDVRESVRDVIDSNEIMSKLETYTAGRISIWTVYCKNMTLRGEENNLFKRTEYAHNQYIELSYKAGVFTGVIYFILVLIIGVAILKRLRRNIYNRKDVLYQLSTYFIFFIVTMLDTGILPFERGYIFIFYIAIAPLFIKTIE